MVDISEEFVQLQYGLCKKVKIQNKSPIEVPGIQDCQDEDIWLRKACPHEKNKNEGKRCACRNLYYEENLPSNVPASKVIGNQFLAAFIHAYNNHQDIVLSPDDVWMHILFEFASYVNGNAEKMRSMFVDHSGKQELTVTSVVELQESQWHEFFMLMEEAIASKTAEGVVQNLRSDFTTTGTVERLLSTATVMDSFKQYFSYGRVIYCCGIRNALFMGSREDWVHLVDKFEELRKFDIDGKLASWIDVLTPVLNKFLDTYDGKVDTLWWNTIMDYRNERIGSGGQTAHYLTGWIVKFSLPFCRRAWVDSYYLHGKNINVPVNLMNHITGVTKMVNVVGGFGGVNTEECAFRPSMSLAVVVVVEK